MTVYALGLALREIEKIDAMADSSPSPDSSKQDSDSEELLPALFWDGSEDWINEDNCADYAALQSLKYDDTTPDERAEEYKLKGNDALKYKQNKIYVRKAVQQYTLALIEVFEDSKLRAVIHSNRAHAALLLGNFGKALEDAKRCVQLDPNSVKGFFRAAKASYGLRNLEECREFCDKGLGLEPDNDDFKSILKNIKKSVDAKEARERRLVEARTTTRKYLATIDSRKIKLGPPVMGAGEHFPKIHDDDESGVEIVTYWTLFVYPVSMQTDIIEGFDERATLGEQAEEMFGEGAPPMPWDGDGNYTRDRLEFYYQSNATAQYPAEVLYDKLMQAHGGGDDDTETQKAAWQKPTVDPRDQKMVLMDEIETLGEILQKDGNVVPGHPVFYVVAKGTEFREKFLAGEWEL